MKICSKSFFFFLIIPFFMLSCNRSQEKALNNQEENRPTEEEIKYYHVTGRYKVYSHSVNVDSLLTEYYNGVELGEAYQHLTEEDLYSYVDINSIKEDVYKAGSKRELVQDVKSLVDLSDFVKVKNRTYFKLKVDLHNYIEFEEYYTIERSTAHVRKYYCKELNPWPLQSQPSLYDMVFVRLYDKKGQIISEDKMGKETFHIVTRPPTEPNLIGVLELPAKSEREGLKYRVVRLKPDGQPSLYFNSEFQNPKQNYMWEEELPPYSEYKNWDYSDKMGCYIYSRSFTR